MENLREITDHAYWVLVVFLVGYTSIVIEQLVKFNKAAVALLMAVGCWIILFAEPYESTERHLYIFTFQMFKVTQVLFFLLGALTIVELISAHRGFSIVVRSLRGHSKCKLMWMSGIFTFFLSSVLDNLTTTVMMISLLTKLVVNREERLLLGGMVVIAANVGGAWTPIGDVATTLLWIYGQVSTLAIMKSLFFPSLMGLFAALIWFSFKFQSDTATSEINKVEFKPEPGGTLVLILGIAALIFVPIFKTITGLPSFMGMMLGLGVLWVITDLMHYRHPERDHLRVSSILPKIEVSVIFFYLGILLSINSLESSGLLTQAALWLDQHLHSMSMIAILIGLISSLVDNVSLVAAAIGMYDLKQTPTDSTFWQLLAYCAGTGGSLLVIGSAAGVALMALEKVNFMWYMKKITTPALLTYFVGIGVYFLIEIVF